jgi:hypothetical protein
VSFFDFRVPFKTSSLDVMDKDFHNDWDSIFFLLDSLNMVAIFAGVTHKKTPPKQNKTCFSFST